MRHLIIGNGIAGTTAALNIRKQDAQAEITILSQEPYRFYSRIKLIDFISSEMPENKLFGFAQEWYARNHINLHLNTSAQSLDPQLREVRTQDGSVFYYDKLLIATGGSPRLPPVASALSSSRICALRNLDHAKHIRLLANSASSVLVLGGGILGIETAGALQKTGKQVTILESKSRLLPYQMDAVGSQILRTILEKRGLDFLQNAQINTIADTANQIQIQLENGQTVSADMLVVSTGINPCSELVQTAKSNSSDVPKKISVNDYFETNLPDIYAAGDVAEHQGISYGILAAAERQGKIAGINMAGGKEKYQGTIPSFILKVPGVDLVCVGEIDVKNSLPSLVQQNSQQGLYRKLVFKDGLLVGYILCGSADGKKELLAALQKKESLATIEKIIHQTGWRPHTPLATIASEV